MNFLATIQYFLHVSGKNWEQLCYIRDLIHFLSHGAWLKTWKVFAVP